MRKDRMMAFTLIELLIVVAIIAILAAIAVPNFLEAQMRSKISRCKNDMRSMAVAMEAYDVEFNRYPLDGWGYNHLPAPRPATPPILLKVLTTPVAYMTSLPQDIFKRGSTDVERAYLYYGQDDTLFVENPANGIFAWAAPWAPHKHLWGIETFGPDQVNNSGTALRWSLEAVIFRSGPNGPYGSIYDATNGTISRGDIVRVGP